MHEKEKDKQPHLNWYIINYLTFLKSEISKHKNHPRSVGFPSIENYLAKAFNDQLAAGSQAGRYERSQSVGWSGENQISFCCFFGVFSFRFVK